MHCFVGSWLRSQEARTSFNLTVNYFELGEGLAWLFLAVNSNIPSRISIYYHRSPTSCQIWKGWEQLIIGYKKGKKGGIKWVYNSRKYNQTYWICILQGPQRPSHWTRAEQRVLKANREEQRGKRRGSKVRAKLEWTAGNDFHQRERGSPTKSSTNRAR